MTGIVRLSKIEATAPYDTMMTRLTEASRVDTSRDPERKEQVSALAIAAWLAVIAERFDDAASKATAALEAATEDHLNEMLPLLRALTMVIDAFRGRRGLDHLVLDELRILESASPTGSDLELESILEVANWFTFADRYEEAAFLVDRRVVHAKARNDVVAEIWSLSCRIELDLRRGRWSQCESALAEARSLSAAADLPTGYLDVLAARLATGRGLVDEARFYLRSARMCAYDLGDASTLWRADAVEGFGALLNGDPETAALLLTPLAGQPTPSGGHLSSVRLWDTDLVESLARIGRIEEASRSAKLLATTFPSSWSTATELRNGALVEQDLSKAVRNAERSAEIFERVGSVFERARSELVAGQLALRDGDLGAAKRLLRRALTTFDALGASPLHQVAATELLKCDREPTTDRSPHLQVLTDREHEIAQAVAAGRSNREIATQHHISVRTVESHLTAIYRKLGVSSRTQLAVAVR